LLKNEYVSTEHDVRAIFLLVERDGKTVARFRVERRDTPMLREHTWSVRADGYGYCTKCKVLIHRLIMGAKPGQLVDHINRVPSDNVRTNLRFGTHAQNMQNRASNSTRNLTVHVPIAGIEPTRSGRWRARRSSGRSLGTYEDLYDACLARARWELEHKGEWTPVHRRWIKRLPMEYKVSWLPEIFGPDCLKYRGSNLHRAFFADKYARGKYDYIAGKLHFYLKQYRAWKSKDAGQAASNV